MREQSVTRSILAYSKIFLLCFVSCSPSAGKIQQASIAAGGQDPCSTALGGPSQNPCAVHPIASPPVGANGNLVPIPVVPLTRTVTVTSDAELSQAIAAAVSGDQIVLSAPSFVGPLNISGKVGIALTAAAGVTVSTGSSTAPCVTLTDCSKCTLTGFSIKGGQKGLMVINTTDSVFDHLEISQTLMEAVHLKTQSSNNTIQSCVVHDAGLGGDTPAGNNRTQADDGEGIYIGTAISNGAGDTTNNVKILNNKIYSTTAENIDIKEFTSGGLISGNSLDCNRCGSGATANLEIKGSDYTAVDNIIINKFMEGIRQYNVPGAPPSVGTNSIMNNQGL